MLHLLTENLKAKVQVDKIKIQKYYFSHKWKHY